MNTVRRHPYVFVSIISLLAAVLVWWFTPKEYGAQTKIYDEYKETDLSDDDLLNLQMQMQIKKRK